MGDKLKQNEFLGCTGLRRTGTVHSSDKRSSSSDTVDVVIWFQEDDIEAPHSDLQDSPEACMNENCWRNLAPYFKRFDGKVAVVAKPCDTRSIVNLIAENQLERENITIIGIECGGVLNRDGVLAHGCLGCTSTVPAIWDYPVAADGGKEFIGLPSPPSTDTFVDFNADSSREDRRNRFLREIDKCILCYSCRQACPGCYCESCFVDRKMTNWHQRDVDTGNKIAFHLTRAMHLAGRCVTCGACENVCLRVSLGTYTMKLTDLSKTSTTSCRH